MAARSESRLPRVGTRVASSVYIDIACHNYENREMKQCNLYTCASLNDLDKTKKGLLLTDDVVNARLDIDARMAETIYNINKLNLIM